MRHLTGALAAAALAALLSWSPPAARAAEPIKIGFSMELTGPFAVVGKTGLLAFKIWEDEVNAEGGLLGRPVKLIYYDDQSNPSLVPGIYTKLIDIDKVDLLISSYGTNLVVPAMPIAISHNRLFFGLFALAANDNFHYPKYFSMLPFGPEPVKTFAEGWFDLAAAQNPKPKTVAIVNTDAEFQHKAAQSARDHAKAKGIDIVYAGPIRRRRSTSHRSFAPCRPPNQISSTSPRTHPTRSASCVRWANSASIPGCWAAALPDCRRQRSRCSSARRPMVSSMSICGSRSRPCNFPAS
jgi:ABC-type branched-subunit amino acid transport system substrate-binding protein